MSEARAAIRIRRGPGPGQQLPGDDRALDLRGALINAWGADLPVLVLQHAIDPI
jgi:hypothetical protein